MRKCKWDVVRKEENLVSREPFIYSPVPRVRQSYDTNHDSNEAKSGVLARDLLKFQGLR